MKSSDRLIYQNSNGGKIEFSYYSVYNISNFDDCSLSNSITSTKNNQMDGETYISDSLGARKITIEGYFRLVKNSAAIERQLKKVLNPKLMGTLTFRSKEEEKSIEVKAEGLPDMIKENGCCSFTIDLVAHDPFWREKEKTEYIALLRPLFHFVLGIPQKEGVAFGVKTPLLETEVENIGDIESGFRVVFRARGTVKNPQISNKLTGQKIRILYTMEKGDIIEVINQPNKKQVLINGEKSFKYLDRLNTVFFNLAVGRNLIGYLADENTVNLDVIVYYSPLYL